ncbi:hypothetical protein [Nocardioides sp.]|uniref:hypothetical protein n=1 Tax=Nocardioides sp. TaxID=35761 RepID=UPI0039E372C9
MSVDTELTVQVSPETTVRVVPETVPVVQLIPEVAAKAAGCSVIAAALTRVPVSAAAATPRVRRMVVDMENSFLRSTRVAKVATLVLEWSRAKTGDVTVVTSPDTSYRCL